MIRAPSLHVVETRVIWRRGGTPSSSTTPTPTPCLLLDHVLFLPDAISDNPVRAFWAICDVDPEKQQQQFLVELVGAEEDVHLVDDRRARRRRNRRGGDVHISSHKDNLVRCALATDRQREEVVRCRAEVSDAGHSLFRERPQVRDAVGSLGLLGHLRVERAQEGQVEAPVGGERLRDLSKEARDEGGCARRAHRLEAHAEDIEVPDGVDSEVGWDLYMYVCTRVMKEM